jgi:membrane fusion protein (multidrug efflux system)
MNPHSSRSVFHLVALAVLAFASTVRLGAEEEKADTNVAVSVAKVVRTPLRSYVMGYGPVETSPTGGARLAASASGLVVAVPVLEGAKVEKDALLVQLDARAADAAVARAEATVMLAEKAHTRQTGLSAVEGTSERAVQEATERLAAAQGELAAAKLQQSQLAIRAPIAGMLSRLRARPGEWLDAGKEVAEIVDLDRLVVAVQIPSSEAAALRPNQRAEVFARIGKDEKPLAEGTVQFVSPQINPDNDSVLARIDVPSGSALRPGQLVFVRVISNEKHGCLAVPVESLVKAGDNGYVISIVENGVARQRSVQVGLRDGGLAEITGEGLSDGMIVVTSGAYGLPQETKVTVRQP